MPWKRINITKVLWSFFLYPFFSFLIYTISLWKNTLIKMSQSDWFTFNATFHCIVWDLKFLSEIVSYSFLYTWLNFVHSRSIMQHKSQKCRVAETRRHPWRSSSSTSCSNRIAEAMIAHWRLCPVGFWLSPKTEIPQMPWSSHTSVWLTSFLPQKKESS